MKYHQIQYQYIEKKDTNTLYTINALNELIKSLNGGVVDTQFPIDWQHYRNCILLTQHNEIKQLNTKIFKIIELQKGYKGVWPLFKKLLHLGILVKNKLYY